MGLFGFKKKKACKKNTCKKYSFDASFVDDKKLNRKEKVAFFSGLNGKKLPARAARYKKLYEKGKNVSQSEDYHSAYRKLAYLGHHCNVYHLDKYGNLKISGTIPYDYYKKMQKDEKYREQTLRSF